MTTLDDFDHDHWLQAVACGEIDVADERFARHAAECGRCRAEIDGLLLLQQQLDAAGREESATLRRVAAPSPARTRTAVADFVHARLAEKRVSATNGHRSEDAPQLPFRPEVRTAVEPKRVGAGATSRSQKPTPTRWGVWISVAAAAVVVFAWLTKFLRPETSTPQRAPMLGTKSDSVLTPNDRVEGSYAPLKWNALELQPGGQFHLIVRDDGPSPNPEPILDMLLTEKEWSGDTSLWPSQIKWSVHVLDATGAVVDSPPAARSWR